MGVKKIMDTFFASMQEQSMAGYGGRLVNTPMGPFRWNDTMQLWENVNNGMVMNNISFQDSIMMLDYASYDGGNLPSITISGPTPLLSINFAGETLGSVFTVTRSTSAFTVNTDNTISSVLGNQPKYILGSDYYNNGLLVEKGTTNYIYNSSTLDTTVPIASGGWTSISCTMVTDNSVLNPKGEEGSMKLTATAKTFVSGARYSIEIAGTTANDYWAYSAWVRAGSVNTATLYVLGVQNSRNYNGQVGIPCNVKILTGPGKVAPSKGGETWWKAVTELSSSEWTRVQWTPTSPIYNAFVENNGVTLNFIVPNLYIGTYEGLGVQGVNPGDSIYVWGAQYESGPYTTSYIETSGVGSNLYRAPDRVVDFNIQNDWFNGSCGSFLVEFDRRSDDYNTEQNFTRTVIATGITSNKHIYIGYTSGSNYGIFGWFDGSTLISGLSETNKFAFSYIRGITGQITASLNGNNATLYNIGNINELGCGTNWLSIGAKLSYNTPTSLLPASLTGFTDTTVKSLKYWNYVLTAEQLKAQSS